jgi:hypothetical protein
MKHVVMLLLCLFTCYGIYARPFRHADTLVISTPVYHNLYLAGRVVTINAPVFADVYVTGAGVIIKLPWWINLICKPKIICYAWRLSVNRN